MACLAFLSASPSLFPVGLFPGSPLFPLFEASLPAWLGQPSTGAGDVRMLLTPALSQGLSRAGKRQKHSLELITTPSWHSWTLGGSCHIHPSRRFLESLQPKDSSSSAPQGKAGAKCHHFWHGLVMVVLVLLPPISPKLLYPGPQNFFVLDPKTPLSWEKGKRHPGGVRPESCS